MTVEIRSSGLGRLYEREERSARGGTLTQVLSAETTLANASTDIGFGVGEKADYLFDDVRFFDPTATGEQSTIGRRYAYDARGRRVAETTFEDGVAETTYFVYDGHRVIEELDGNGNVTASYVYGQYIDEVLQMRRDTDPGAAGMEVHYYLHDDLFNVVGLADASGALRERYEYADYGMPAVYDAANNPLAASAFQNAYLFNGRRFDAATGLYYYRTRYMDPELGRFISRDTIGLWGDANNLGNPYSYVGNNPWSRLDPFGEATLQQSEQVFLTAAEIVAKYGNRTALGKAGEEVMEGLLIRGGYVIVKGPSTNPGSGHNADIIAWDPEAKELFFIDNKIQTQKGTVSWADNLADTAPGGGRAKSIAEMEGLLKGSGIDSATKKSILAASENGNVKWLVTAAAPEGVNNLASKVSHRMHARGVLYSGISKNGRLVPDAQAVGRQTKPRGKGVGGRVLKSIVAVGAVAQAYYASDAIAQGIDEDIAYAEIMATMGVYNPPYAHHSALRAGITEAGSLAIGEVGGYAGGLLGAAGIVAGPVVIVTLPAGSIIGGMAGDEIGLRGAGYLFDQF